MPNKPAYTIEKQIEILKSRGLLFKDEKLAFHFLSNINYYRLKGYWWDMQSDKINHIFHNDVYFEEVIDRYNFDRKLKLILFDAIERIEIALRTKMIYHLSLKYEGLWYLNENLFDDKKLYEKSIDDLKKEYDRSQEVFIKDHKKRNPKELLPDSWKFLEIASLGTLSKLYKCLKHQLPEKSDIAKSMGLNFHNELSSWIEAITYLRNIIAHHSQLWSRNMVKIPIEKIKTKSLWFEKPLLNVQKKKAFLIISCLLFLCNKVTPNHNIKSKIFDLFNKNKNISIYKIGFLNDWENEPLWRNY